MEKKLAFVLSEASWVCLSCLTKTSNSKKKKWQEITTRMAYLQIWERFQVYWLLVSFCETDQIRLCSMYED